MPVERAVYLLNSYLGREFGKAGQEVAQFLLENVDTEDQRVSPDSLHIPVHVEKLLRLKTVALVQVLAIAVMEGRASLAERRDHAVLAGKRVTAPRELEYRLVQAGNGYDVVLVGAFLGTDRPAFLKSP